MNTRHSQIKAKAYKRQMNCMLLYLLVSIEMMHIEMLLSLPVSSRLTDMMLQVLSGIWCLSGISCQLKKFLDEVIILLHQ